MIIDYSIDKIINIQLVKVISYKVIMVEHQLRKFYQLHYS